MLEKILSWSFINFSLKILRFIVFVIRNDWISTNLTQFKFISVWRGELIYSSFRNFVSNVYQNQKQTWKFIFGSYFNIQVEFWENCFFTPEIPNLQFHRLQLWYVVFKLNVHERKSVKSVFCITINVMKYMTTFNLNLEPKFPTSM